MCHIISTRSYFLPIATARRLAYVAALNSNEHRPDEMTVVDLDPGSTTYSQLPGSTCLSTAVIPEPIAQLQRQLDQIRSTQPRGKKLPDSVWQAAVELAREHGVYSVAHPLRLDYTGLKKRLGGVSHRRRKVRKPAFVEVIAPPSAMLRECLIEFESLHGGKVRIQWKAAAPPDWMSLLRAWRETER